MTRHFSYKCTACEYTHEYTALIEICPQCGGNWLEFVYNLEDTAAIWQQKLSQRPVSMWRYWELLPMLNKKKRNIVG